MLYKKIDSAIAVCEQYISRFDSDNIDGKEVESYLVAGLVVLIVSEYEVHLKNIFCQRASQCNDQYVSNYIENVLQARFRSPNQGKITETLQQFSKTYLDEFNKEMENFGQNRAAWDLIIQARHAVVHKSGQLTITFRELKKAYNRTKKLISSVESVLGIGSIT